jgi:hypothetical protein
VDLVWLKMKKYPAQREECTRRQRQRACGICGTADLGNEDRFNALSGHTVVEFARTCAGATAPNEAADEFQRVVANDQNM